MQLIGGQFHRAVCASAGGIDDVKAFERSIQINIHIFTNAERTLWHDEDLDVPTYLRRNLTLDR